MKMTRFFTPEVIFFTFAVRESILFCISQIGRGSKARIATMPHCVKVSGTEPNSAAACGNTTTPAIHAEQIKNDTFSPRFLNMPRPKTGPVLRIL